MTWKTKTGLCLMALLLSGCEILGAGTKASTSDFCAIARPIYVSRQDSLTDGTARAVLDHNEIGKKLCGWGKAK